LGNASIEDDDEFWPKVSGTKARNERQSLKKPFILLLTHAQLALVDMASDSQNFNS
jgi:hypothetical protein